ncbi:CLUMA_CG007909, isoform A [Clunio marinus]|uniref:CLUMA_CG007909, isoform A n=1 Tax=Clunio marinus TaxID=568069 RepID=A0A1J1I3R5_9DIPT|nr:CLUMA_CG007909, isoform A [Clunio marinus]
MKEKRDFDSTHEYHVNTSKGLLTETHEGFDLLPHRPRQSFYADIKWVKVQPTYLRNKIPINLDR